MFDKQINLKAGKLMTNKLLNSSRFSALPMFIATVLLSTPTTASITKQKIAQLSPENTQKLETSAEATFQEAVKLDRQGTPKKQRSLNWKRHYP